MAVKGTPQQCQPGAKTCRASTMISTTCGGRSCVFSCVLHMFCTAALCLDACRLSTQHSCIAKCIAKWAYSLTHYSTTWTTVVNDRGRAKSLAFNWMSQIWIHSLERSTQPPTKWTTYVGLRSHYVVYVVHYDRLFLHYPYEGFVDPHRHRNGQGMRCWNTASLTAKLRMKGKVT